MSHSTKVKVQSFSGATCGDKDHHLQPILSRTGRRPDHVILHIGTNNSSFSKSEEVASNIVSLANMLKIHGINVILSSLITRVGRLNMIE